MKKPATKSADHRRHPRITAPATATVVCESGQTFHYPVRDVSLGGTFLFAPRAPLQVGEEATVALASSDGGRRATLKAELVRTVPGASEDQLLGMGFQFVDLDPDQERALRAFIDAIVSGPGGERRAYPRISHRIDVWCHGRRDVKGLLRDLSEGGCGLWLEPPVDVGEPITVEVEFPGQRSLKLQGTVKSAVDLAPGGPYRMVGVEFEKMDPEKHKLLRASLLALLRG